MFLQYNCNICIILCKHRQWLFPYHCCTYYTFTLHQFSIANKRIPIVEKLYLSISVGMWYKQFTDIYIRKYIYIVKPNSAHVYIQNIHKCFQKMHLHKHLILDSRFLNHPNSTAPVTKKNYLNYYYILYEPIVSLLISIPQYLHIIITLLHFSIAESEYLKLKKWIYVFLYDTNWRI